MTEYEIVVKGVPPSNNMFMGNSHNFNEYRRHKQEWHWLIKVAIKRKPEKPIEKAKVYIKYYFKSAHRRDPDNYSGKMILDPLVREGILKDDSFANVSLNLSAEVDKDNPRTVIRIMEV
jgi:Holliday junction resolvase RusA-like endonuclease